tara:strand:+ start:1068 stop:2579 length:1512 start_codon:yes stop_codon:yes gene_type:complete
MKTFDSIVIGSGPSSEPVLFHLSKTNLKCLVVDSGDLNQSEKDFKGIFNSKKNYKLSPKQILNKFKWIDSNLFKKLNDFLFLRCKKFCYAYSFMSGGLSNSWGGGVSEWPIEEIKKTTSLNTKKVLNSYKAIRERLLIKKRNSFSKVSDFADTLLKIRNKGISFSPAEFFLEKDFKEKENNSLFNQNLIWNSKNTIKSYIIDSNNLEYKSNTKVLYVNKKKNNIWEICCKKKGNIFFIQTKSIILCAGTINSACLAFSATKQKKINLKINHNNLFIVPIFSLRNKIKSLSKGFLEIPELTWQEKIKNKSNITYGSSGYFINSSFIIEGLRKKFPFFKNNLLTKIISLFLSRLGFITVFVPANRSKINLELKKFKFGRKSKIYATLSNESDLVKIKSEQLKIIEKLKKFLPENTYLIRFLKRSVITGGDIHYSSSLSDALGKNKLLNTSPIGEINNLPLIFSADPSRLAYLSSRPHTFTSMAITDSSMPKIIEKILCSKINSQE